MNISLNWLKEYLKIDLSVEKVCEILTSIGLEVGGYEKFESIRGGLRGLVIGEVKTCEAHPDSDHLHLTTVDLPRTLSNRAAYTDSAASARRYFRVR